MKHDINRPIKFRYWDEVKKKMYSAKEMADNSQELYETNKEGEFRCCFVLNPMGDRRYLIPMQYTDCKDKNSKDIYDGDIVSHKGIIGFVEYIAGMYVLSYKDQTDSGPIGFLQTADMEVIGNIFENPELLK